MQHTHEMLQPKEGVGVARPGAMSDWIAEAVSVAAAVAAAEASPLREAIKDRMSPAAKKAAAEAIAEAAAEDLTLAISRGRFGNATGYRGVCFHNGPSSTKPKPYQAYLKRDGKQKNLGYYGTAEEAALARARRLGPEESAREASLTATPGTAAGDAASAKRKRVRSPASAESRRVYGYDNPAESRPYARDANGRFASSGEPPDVPPSATPPTIEAQQKVAVAALARATVAAQQQQKAARAAVAQGRAQQSVAPPGGASGEGERPYGFLQVNTNDGKQTLLGYYAAPGPAPDVAAPASSHSSNSEEHTEEQPMQGAPEEQLDPQEPVWGWGWAWMPA